MLGKVRRYMCIYIPQSCFLFARHNQDKCVENHLSIFCFLEEKLYFSRLEWIFMHIYFLGWHNIMGMCYQACIMRTISLHFITREKGLLWEPICQNKDILNQRKYSDARIHKFRCDLLFPSKIKIFSFPPNISFWNTNIFTFLHHLIH